MIRVSTKTGWPKISTFTALFQYIPEKFSTSTEKFSTLHLTKFEKISKIWISRSNCNKYDKNMKKFPDLLAAFPPFFSASGPPLKNQYYFRTFRKFWTCRHPDDPQWWPKLYSLLSTNRQCRKNRDDESHPGQNTQLTLWIAYRPLEWQHSMAGLLCLRKL